MSGAKAWSLPQVRRVAWLVDVAANRQPVIVRCLARSLALAWMLRRRGLNPEFRIGVKRDGDGVDAHAWVEWRGHYLQDSMPRPENYVIAGSGRSTLNPAAR